MQYLITSGRWPVNWRFTDTVKSAQGSFHCKLYFRASQLCDCPWLQIFKYILIFSCNAKILVLVYLLSSYRPIAIFLLPLVENHYVFFIYFTFVLLLRNKSEFSFFVLVMVFDRNKKALKQSVGCTAYSFLKIIIFVAFVWRNWGGEYDWKIEEISL